MIGFKPNSLNLSYLLKTNTSAVTAKAFDWRPFELAVYHSHKIALLANS